jgi:anti-sigma regulatory factor (Ser/Thr protein kinase)
MIELVDKSAAEARQALTQIGHGHVADTILEDLLIGVTEAVTNALLHGRAPVTVRLWATPDRIVITVHDQGRGPADPLAGLVPTPSSRTHPGLGLWLIHQLDMDVALKHADDGFTVRLRGGTTIGLATRRRAGMPWGGSRAALIPRFFRQRSSGPRTGDGQWRRAVPTLKDISRIASLPVARLLA